ncbi:serine--tRNA ligase [Methanobacterium petrolearium]|uniref:serine--tRNA ligase n=1 Tax=Methanobacterium petrolearium TaxID=710190 RepID=UPI001AE167E5|nr:serine--tRNA ligase [Methanobacterium petrolearium]MBP1946136.1 seryl-tRNA synthetase [Methanobacterium petrolearium]BDZ70722.1 serine--tRNA ligase [Methanobacterium petrolearium]
MLDIKLFRETPDLIRESERKRFRDTTNVDKVIEYDHKWREAIHELNMMRSKRNKLSESFKNARKKKTEEGNAEFENIRAQSKDLGKKIGKLEPKIQEFLEKRDEYRYKVGNLLDESVPLSENEEDNLIVRKVGELPSFNYKPCNHVDLIHSVDGVNLEKASQIAGSRSYYLKADLVYLNLALMKFALDVLVERGFTPFQTPFFIKHEVVKEAAELADFEDMLYKVEGEDLYMIATSEQTLAALHHDEILDGETLPRKYCGVSTCFRREAGSHGKDTLGIFRVHQFEKVEQFIFCKEEESKEIHEELIQNAEIIYQKLKIPYRVVSIVSSALNDNASLKYDLEAWFPGSDTYRELVSCTNCLDYQARKLNARYGVHGDSVSKKFCHTLNSTAIATERTICCILENYQQPDGTVKVPEVLIPYMNGKTVIGKQE